MPELSPRELLKIFYPDPVPAGQFAFYTTTLEKGNEHSHWCHYAPQADRLVHGFRNTRRAVDRHFDPGRGAAGAGKRRRGRLRLRLLASPPPSIVSPRGSSRTTDKRPPPSATACAPSRTGPAAVVSWSSKAAPAAASPGHCTPPSHPTT